MPHFPPVRVGAAILLLLVVAGALLVTAVRMRRRRRRPPPAIRVDLVGSAGGADERPSA